MSLNTQSFRKRDFPITCTGRPTDNQNQNNQEQNMGNTKYTNTSTIKTVLLKTQS